MNYGILNQESGQYLSRTNSFTYEKSEAFKTTKDHANWLLERFQKENEYMVEVIEF